MVKIYSGHDTTISLHVRQIASNKLEGGCSFGSFLKFRWPETGRLSFWCGCVSSGGDHILGSFWNRFGDRLFLLRFGVEM